MCERVTEAYECAPTLAYLAGVGQKTAPKNTKSYLQTVQIRQTMKYSFRKESYHVVTKMPVQRRAENQHSSEENGGKFISLDTHLLPGY